MGGMLENMIRGVMERKIGRHSSRPSCWHRSVPFLSQET